MSVASWPSRRTRRRPVAEVRARLRSAGPQRGSTLVEMLVAMSIFSLAMTLVFGAVITVMRKSSDVQKSAMRRALCGSRWSGSTARCAPAMCCTARRVRHRQVARAMRRTRVEPACGCSPRPTVPSGACNGKSWPIRRALARACCRPEAGHPTGRPRETTRRGRRSPEG